MALVKVKHGAIWWEYDHTGEDGVTRKAQDTAFRGMVVDIPASEAKRLSKLGAVIDPKEELPLGGELSPVPSTASDEELLAWASVANRQDILDAIKAQPALGDRILAAYEIVQRRLQDQSEFLGGLRPDIERIQAEAEDDEDNDGDEDEDEDSDDVVKGNVDAVSKFLSENPGRHADILDAENRRAAAQGAKPPHVRDGVVEAVKAAAAHTGN